MPDYVIKLANGKELVLTGDAPPSDTDVEAAASQAGVRALLVPAKFANHPANRAAAAESNNVGAGTVGAAELVRRGVERTAMQVATSPNVGKVTRAISGPAVARGVTAAVGAVVGGVPGAIAGAAIPTASIARRTARIAETGIRGGASLFARMAASPLMRAVTGPAAGAIAETNATRRALVDYANDPNVDPAVREAYRRAIEGGGF